MGQKVRVERGFHMSLWIHCRILDKWEGKREGFEECYLSFGLYPTYCSERCRKRRESIYQLLLVPEQCFFKGDSMCRMSQRNLL